MRSEIMGKNRVAGAAKQARETVKEAVGKVAAVRKLQTGGRSEKLAGAAQNAFGCARDTVRLALGLRNT